MLIPPAGYFGDDVGARFATADDARLRWIRSCPPVQRHEEAIHQAFVLGGEPILEVGAGEGLTPLFRPELTQLRYVASDLFFDRAKAAGRAAGDRVIPTTVCDASSLPFGDGAFGTVLCRDLLHHLERPARERAVREMARVLRDDGCATVIEPNGSRSPLMALFSAAVPTERMALSFDASTLHQLLRTAFDDVDVQHIEPSLLYRLLFHYRFGKPSLAASPVVAGAVTMWEQWMRHAPRSMWSYLRLVCRRPRRSR